MIKVILYNLYIYRNSQFTCTINILIYYKSAKVVSHCLHEFEVHFSLLCSVTVQGVGHAGRCHVVTAVRPSRAVLRCDGSYHNWSVSGREVRSESYGRELVRPESSQLCAHSLTLWYDELALPVWLNSLLNSLPQHSVSLICLFFSPK